MKKRLLYVTLESLFVSVAIILALATMVAMAGGSEIHIGELVHDRPEVSQRWFLTAVLSSKDSPTQRDLELYSLLRNNPKMRALINQTVYTEWDNSTEFVVKSGWSKYLGSNRPALMLQTPAKPGEGTGDVVFFASGSNLVIDDTLPRKIQLAINDYVDNRENQRIRPLQLPCPDGSCPLQPRPSPSPSPAPAPDTPDLKPIPQITPSEPSVDPAPDTEETPLLLVLLPALLGGGLGLYQEMKKSRV